MKIVSASKNKWHVLSDSGKTYLVSLKTKLDEMGSMYFAWDCDCPSRKAPCKHIDFVEQQTTAMDDQSQERIE